MGLHVQYSSTMLLIDAAAIFESIRRACHQAAPTARARPGWLESDFPRRKGRRGPHASRPGSPWNGARPAPSSVLPHPVATAPPGKSAQGDGARSIDAGASVRAGSVLTRNGGGNSRIDELRDLGVGSQEEL